MIKMRTQKFFIERSVQFEEEPMLAAKIRESSSPPPPLTVCEEDNRFYIYDMYDNNYLILYPNTPAIPKWKSNNIHAPGELVGNPNDPRTRSQLKSVISIKDP